MTSGTELQVLLVENDPREYSQPACLLRGAGYVVVKCTVPELGALVESVRADAVVVAASTRDTITLLRSLPPGLDPASMLVISNAPDMIGRLQPQATCLSIVGLEQQLTQAVDMMLFRPMASMAVHEGAAFRAAM
jgi:hypothetical protein